MHPRAGSLCQVPHNLTGDLELDGLKVRLLVIGLAVFLEGLEPSHRGMAELVADLRLDEDRRRRVHRLQSKGFHRPHVRLDQVSLQGEGEALHHRKPYFHVLPFVQRLHMIGRLGRRGRVLCLHTLERDDRKRDAVHVHIFRNQPPRFRIGIIVKASQPAPHDLFA